MPKQTRNFGATSETGQQQTSNNFIGTMKKSTSTSNDITTTPTFTTTFDSEFTSFMVTKALANGINAEQAHQLQVYLLARGTLRLLTFWLRHPTPTTTRTDLATHLDAAKAFMARHAHDEASGGALLQRVEASYKTGPSPRKPEKYEIFEDIVLWDEGEDERLRKHGRELAKQVMWEDKGFWDGVKELLGEFWDEMGAEAWKQGTLVGEKTSLRVTEGVERALKELLVKVEVQVRKRLRKLDIYPEVVLRGRFEEEGKKKNNKAEPRRGRKRRSEDDMGFEAFRGIFL